MTAKPRRKTTGDVNVLFSGVRGNTYGLFSNKNASEGTLFWKGGWFDGEIVPIEDAKIVVATDRNLARYFKDLDQHWSVDGRPIANLRKLDYSTKMGYAAFANTTEDRDSANVKFLKVETDELVPYYRTHNGSTHILEFVLEATKPIAEGDELLVLQKEAPPKQLLQFPEGAKHYKSELFNELQKELAADEYTFAEELGKGAFGKVGKYWATVRRRWVAIKAVPYGTIPKNQRLKARRNHGVTKELYFLKKILVAQKGDQEAAEADVPGLVQLLDSFLWLEKSSQEGAENPLWLHMVMPYYPFSLTTLMLGDGWRRDFPIPVLKEIYRQICLGTREMRKRNVVHGDLNPNNVVIDFGKNFGADPRTVTAKIIDFGAASFAGTGKEYPVRKCTLNYRAPEALLGNLYYRETCNSDLWSLGVMGGDLFFSDGPFFPVLLDPALRSVEDAEAWGGDEDLEVVPRLGSILSVLGTPTREELLELNPALPNFYLDLLSGVKVAPKMRYLTGDRPGTILLESLVVPLLKWKQSHREVGFEEVLKNFMILDEAEHAMSSNLAAESTFQDDAPLEEREFGPKPPLPTPFAQPGNKPQENTWLESALKLTSGPANSLFGFGGFKDTDPLDFGTPVFGTPTSQGGNYLGDQAPPSAPASQQTPSYF